MGADLSTLKSMSDNQAIKIDYIRDSYNCYNTMHLMDFSYWQIVEEKPELFDSEGDMTVDGAKYMLQYLKDNKAKFDENVENPPEDVTRYFETKQGIKDWQKHQKQNYKDMLDFYSGAIEAKSSIVWSV